MLGVGRTVGADAAERAERWWDQRVHYPAPPPSLPPLTSPQPAVSKHVPLVPPPPLIDSEPSRLCEALQHDTGEHIVLQHLGLRDAQAVSLTCKACQHSVLSLVSQATCVHAHAPRDATFAAAAWVARQMPNLRRLVILGIHSLDICIDLASFRSLADSGRPILIGHLNKESALFVGAVLASRECTFVTSDSRRIALRALRESACVRLRGVRGTIGLGDADLAALLGAISLNGKLEELDLCANPAPTSQWVAHALNCATRRERCLIRHHRRLTLPGVVRAAPSLEMALMRGLALPGWLAPHASGEASRQGREYCLPVPAWVAGGPTGLEGYGPALARDRPPPALDGAGDDE